MPEGARRGSTKKGGKTAPRPSSVSSLGGIGVGMASDPMLGSCTSVNTVCSDSDRPVSLSSSASSASLQDSHSSFGSSGGLLGCPPPPPPSYAHRNGSDISLDLTPVALLDAPGYPKDHPGRAKERRMKLSHLDRVVLEIVETEQAYVRDLRSIVEDYLGCIIDCGQLPLKPEQVNALFCNIEDIYEFNSELLEDMERNPSPHAVAECFVQRSEEFDIYTLYCMNYPNSVSVLRECMENEALAKFFRERQATLSHSLPLETYLLKPVQRILKYHLLLQELAKHYDKSSAGYEAVEEASITMTAVAWYINDMKRKQEHATRLQEIEGLLLGWNGPELGAFGELILEGQFRVPRARKERVFFLLSKVILIAKRRGDTFIYKSHIFCCNLALQENTKDPMSFKISDLSIPKQQHVVQVRNQEEKRLWIHYLKRLIVENHPASIPQKAKQVLLENSFQSSPEAYFGAESPKKPLPSPRLDECKASARNRRQSDPPEYMYSPERARRSCPVLALEKSGSSWRGRRQSEPAKDSPILFHQADVDKLKASDSDGELFPTPEQLNLSGAPSASVSVLVGDSGAEKSDPDKGEAEFSLAEESIPSNFSITEEILELLSQRGLDQDAGKDVVFVDEVKVEASHLDAQDQPLPKVALGEGEEKGEEEEGTFQEDPSIDAIHGPRETIQDHLAPVLRHSFTSDSSEEEERQQEGSDGPSPLHVLEDLGSAEASGKLEETLNEVSHQDDTQTREILCPEDGEQSRHPTAGLQKAWGGPREVKKTEEGPKRDSTLTKEDWLLIEKIKNYYEGVEMAVATVVKKDYTPPPVPPGVVRESILRFNSILQRTESPDGEVGGARPRRFCPPSARSQSNNVERSPSHEDSKEGRSQMSLRPEASTRGRSSSEGGQSASGGAEPSAQGRSHSFHSENEQNSRLDVESSVAHMDRGNGLEDDRTEFKSCAEIRRAWQEKERETMDGGNRQSYASPEKTLYVEPLRIVEDSDLEDPPPVPNRGPEGAKAVEMPTEESSAYLPTLGIYENNGGDPCLLENSERILSKVQALAKMYSEKISRLKVQKRGAERPGMRPRDPHRKGPIRTSVGTPEGKLGPSIPQCEPRIYGHVLIHEPLQHVIGIQENTPLLAVTRGTALELRSERPPRLLSLDLLAPLRQSLLSLAPGPSEAQPNTFQNKDLSENSESHLNPSMPTTGSKEKESPLPLKRITEAGLCHMNAKTPKDVGDVVPSFCRNQVEASRESEVSGFSLEPQQKLRGPVDTDASIIDKPKPRFPSSTTTEGPSPLKEEHLPSLPSDDFQANKANSSPPLELNENNNRDAEEPNGSKEHSKTLQNTPVLDLLKPQSEAFLRNVPRAVSPLCPGSPLRDAHPAPSSDPTGGSDLSASVPAAPTPKLFPTSPVRRCLSSSAAAISRYIAASCISQSLAKKNGAPQPEELQVPFQPLTPPRPLANPLALLPKAAPRAHGALGKPDTPNAQTGFASPCFRSGPLSPTRHRDFSSTAVDRRSLFSSASEPNSRVQSPLPVKPRVCSPPPVRLQGCTFTPLCAHPPAQPAIHMASPVALAPNPAIRGTVLSPRSRPRGNSLPDRGSTESLSTNGGSAPSLGGQPQDLSGIKWPNVPGLCLKYVNRERRVNPPAEEGDGCPKPDSPTNVDGARPPEKSQQRVSYSTTVNIQIGGSGRIASFSNAQVSLTHPLQATPEPLSLRKVNGSTPKT
nr:PREDICTED: pleckstrin homology domain-containing family G member 2 isoform X2 [Anolis carolinensis]|eukprot:XP_008122084.1 PREDICTED: pleckstrin homology domain-containing family G member 2 isoform X2 [Anolis carolinensis]